ncbi:MAG: hypothetical protein M3209_14400 [Acidobacteriota bacterium]|nr:hypothetical protein [Acidobacteriota bacterium]
MRRKLFSASVLFLYLLNLTPFAFAAREQEKYQKSEKIIEKSGDPDFEDPDLPPGMSIINKDAYISARQEQVSLLRGLPYPKLNSRQKAIFEMESKETALAAVSGEPDAAPQASWRPIGPAPIPNGQTGARTDAVSGRVTSIAVHPTNPNIAYVGTAQGGLYRTLDAGLTWTPMLDDAMSLAIGSVAIAPSDPTIVYVGTGESGFSTDSFFGVGIYRITNADTNPVISGPLNRDAANNDIFTGRSVSEILIHPTDPNIIFASSTRGGSGIGGGTAGLVLPTAGFYRSTNAMSDAPVFQRLNVSISGSVSRETIDAVMEPGNPNRILVAVVGENNDGGVYLTTNALAPTPVFTRTLTTPNATTNGRTELAIQKTGTTVTVYAAGGADTGTVYKSIDGGESFTTAAVNKFCSPQCFYNIAIAVDPNNADRVYLGGAPPGSNSGLTFGFSTNGGTSFTSSDVGLHVDTHAIAVAPSNPNVIYFGSDGGIWISTDAGATWTSRNTPTFSATQFMSLALHPTDRNFLIGGTQDNGTNWYKADGTWLRVTGGDGGHTVIDQNAEDTTSVFGYHTFFNQAGTQIGYQRISTFNANGTGTQPGTFRGCNGTNTTRGINCNDPVLFYAPLSRGPGNPNTLYIGTNKLYRSADRGDSNTVVSQTLATGERISAIGISPNDDNIRIMGSTAGRVYVTTDGSTNLTNVTGAIPARYIGRAKIAGNNTTAYVALGGFGLPAGHHVWKTTNLGNNNATFAPAGNGIPDVPVNALVIDPADPSGNTVYAGTDIGVFRTVDGGNVWTPFSDGLPRVAVFDIDLQPTHRVLKIATHGRGIYELNLSPTRRAPADFDGDNKTDVSVFRPDSGNWFVSNSTNNAFRAEPFGANGDVIVPGDYDGDLKADVAVFRGGFWYINGSQSGFRGAQFGIASDKPVAADYDGDGKTDIAVFRAGAWYISNSSNGQFRGVNWGLPTDLPVPGDYDADGKADVAVFRPTDGNWFVQKSSDGGLIAYAFGAAGDKPVPGDYDGDGKNDFAVFRNGAWYVQQSTAGFRGLGWGFAADNPVPGDYDGDGKTDFAVYRSGNWYISLNANGQFRAINFGLASDVPVPAGYIPLR